MRHKEFKRRAMLWFEATSGLDKLSTNELRSLRGVCKRVSRTNCWFAEYELSPLLLAAITDEFYRRKRVREAKRPPGKTETLQGK